MAINPGLCSPDPPAALLPAWEGDCCNWQQCQHYHLEYAQVFISGNGDTPGLPCNM